jgi:dTDP-4-amino-4,6-dideoxygalactose transaminase
MSDPGIAGYEARFADVVSGRRAVAFAFARTAMQEAAAACGLAPGDRVVLSPLNCKAVPIAFLQRGYRVVYADIDAATMNLDAGTVRTLLAAGARAVVFQHTYGSSAGLEAVKRVADEFGAALFEDRAQCIARRSPPVGSVAFYSNNLRKPLPAGSGGIAVTNDERIADLLAQRRDRLPARGAPQEAKLIAETVLHDWVLRPALYWSIWSLNRKLQPFHARLDRATELAAEGAATSLRPSRRQISRGLRSLAQLESLAGQRLEASRDYASRLRGHAALPIPEPVEPLYYFPVLARHKERLLERARRRRLELVAWPLRTPIYPVENEAELERYGYTPGSCANAEQIAARLVGLPTDQFATPPRRAALIEEILADE